MTTKATLKKITDPPMADWTTWQDTVPSIHPSPLLSYTALPFCRVCDTASRKCRDSWVVIAIGNAVQHWKQVFSREKIARRTKLAVIKIIINFIAFMNWWAFRNWQKKMLIHFLHFCASTVHLAIHLYIQFRYLQIQCNLQYSAVDGHCLILLKVAAVEYKTKKGQHGHCGWMVPTQLPEYVFIYIHWMVFCADKIVCLPC